MTLNLSKDEERVNKATNPGDDIKVNLLDIQKLDFNSIVFWLNFSKAASSLQMYI